MSDFNEIILRGIEDYGEKVIQILTQELINAGKDASGRLIKSLNFDIKPVGDALYQVMLTSEDYLKYVDKGRKPGSYVPIRALKEWVRYRNIPEEAVYAINNKIYRYGIKPTNVIEKTKNRINNETDLIEKAYAEYISAVIISRIKQ